LVVTTVSLDVPQCSLLRFMQQNEDLQIQNSDKIEIHITARIPQFFSVEGCDERIQVF
jgi:hypothetical protein